MKCESSQQRKGTGTYRDECKNEAAKLTTLISQTVENDHCRKHMSSTLIICNISKCNQQIEQIKFNCYLNIKMCFSVFQKY